MFVLAVGSGKRAPSGRHGGRRGPFDPRSAGPPGRYGLLLGGLTWGAARTQRPVRPRSDHRAEGVRDHRLVNAPVLWNAPGPDTASPFGRGRGRPRSAGWHVSRLGRVGPGVARIDRHSPGSTTRVASRRARARLSERAGCHRTRRRRREGTGSRPRVRLGLRQRIIVARKPADDRSGGVGCQGQRRQTEPEIERLQRGGPVEHGVATHGKYLSRTRGLLDGSTPTNWRELGEAARVHLALRVATSSVPYT